MQNNAEGINNHYKHMHVFICTVFGSEPMPISVRFTDRCIRATKNGWVHLHVVIQEKYLKIRKKNRAFH